MRTGCAFILTVLLATASLSAATPASRPADDLAEQRREAAAQIEQRLQSLQSIGTLPSRKIFEFKLENDDLIVVTHMEPMSQPVRVQIEGLHGEATLYLRGGRNPAGGGGMRFMQFRHDDAEHDDDILVSTQVLSGPGYIQVSRGIENPTRQVNISLIENLQMRRITGNAQRQAVRLYVQEIDPQTGRNTVDLKLAAENMSQLLRQHPREMSLYIEPILRDLHQEDAIFSVEPAVAWQVLSDRLAVNPKLADEVNRFVPDLGATSARTRDAASRSLQELGLDAALPLTRLDRAKLSPEQNTRLDALLRPYHSLSESEVKTLQNDPGFLLKCLNTDNRALREAAYGQLQSQFPDLRFDVDAVPDVRHAEVSRLREKYLSPTTRP